MSEGNVVQIGRYRVIDEIGRGGFGRVYRAFDASVGRQVAIKVLTEGGKDVFARFRNEAQVAGNLRHENIVTVYEYGEHEGQPFLAMEYLEGEDLQHILTSGRQLTLLQKTNIMSQVAEGLYCAHSNGVVHRDVKPANIMVLPDGRVKIMDFGIARLTQNRDATRLTQEGWVVGTLLYMAPEQFAGGEVDALCDIFAYGVVYYELLAGRHPFQSPDSRTLMYKISFEDPPPIRDFLPQCPETLERVILKILHKERDLRYHSLKDVQFDTEIVRMDLQTQRAEELVAQAQVQVQADQLDAAQALAVEALSLDPSNRAARSLRESLQKRLQHRALRPRIEALVNSAEERLSTRRFTEAVQGFESALKLDSENAAIRERLAQARELLEHHRAAQNLVAEAQKEMGRQNFTAAYQNATEALRHDRDNPTASELLAKIQVEIENRQREKRIEEALRRAEDLILSRSYDDAISLLTALGSDAASPKVEQLLIWLRKEKADRERREKLQAEMGIVTDLLRARSLTEAVKRLEALRAEYPEEQEPVHLLAYARKELELEARAKAVKELAARAAALADAKDYNAALALLEDALKQYPGETTLIRMLGSTMAAKTAWVRQQAIAKTVRESNELRGQQRLAEAIELVEGALREYSADPDLVSLLEQLEQEWAAKRRADAVRKVSESAVQLLDRKQWQEAQQVLRQALIQYSGEGRLIDLLKRADEELRAQEKARAIEAIIREAISRSAAKEYGRALACLDQGLQTWAGDPALVSLREKVVASQAAAARQKEIESCSERASSLAGRMDFGGALAAIAEALAKFPSERALLDLQARISADWEQHKQREAIRGIASEARLLITRGRLEEAADLLNDSLSRHPGDADLQSLSAQVREAIRAREQARAVEEAVREARDLAGRRRFSDARKVLEEGLAAYPSEAALARELESVKAAGEKWDYEQAIARAVGEAGRLAEQLRFDAALELLARTPGSAPELVEARRRIEFERDAHRTREAVSKGAAEAAALLESGRPDTALKLLEQLSTRYPGQSQWESLIAQARGAMAQRTAAEERRRAVEETIRECDRMVRQDQIKPALERLAAALRQYSDEPALLDLKERLRLAWDERQRAQGVERAAAEARALLSAGKLEEAEASLRQLATKYPGELSIQTLLAQVEKDLADRRERERMASECRALIEQQKFQDAVRQLERALARFPGDAALQSLSARAHGELDRRAREEAITAVVEEAQAVSGAREFDRALTMLERGLTNWPGEQRLLDLQASIRSARDAWKREQARRQALQEVNQLVRKERFGEARIKAEKALKDFGDDADLLRLSRECRMRLTLAEAAGLSAQERPKEGLRVLEQGAAEFGSEPEWRALTERLRSEAAAVERSAEVQRTTKEALTLAGRQDFEAALTRIDARLKEAPQDQALQDARRQVLESQHVHQRQVALNRAMQECTRVAEQGKISEAIERADQAIRDFPGEASLVELRRKFEEKRQTEERRKQRQGDLEQLRQLDARIAEALDSARLAELREAVKGIETKYTGDAEIIALAGKCRDHFTDIENCRKALAQRNFQASLDVCKQYLARYPKHAAFLALQKEAEQGRREAELADLRRRCDAEGDLKARETILAEGQSRFPSEGWISAELKIVRNKLSMADGIIAEARAQEAAGAWERAIEQWNKVATIYERYPGLQSEIQRVRTAQARAAAEAVGRWTSQIEQQLSAGQAGKAGEMLQQALAEFPSAAPLQDLSRRLDALQKKQQRLRELGNAMRDSRKAAKWDAFQKQAAEALELSAGDAASRKSTLERLIEAAQDVVQSDWQRADTWIEQVRAADATFPVPKQLLKAVTDTRRAAAVEAALARAEEFRKAKNVRGAAALLAEALREFPDEKRLKSAHATLEDALQKERAAVVRSLGEIRQACERATQAADLVPLEARVQSIAGESAQDPELAAAAAETARVISARRKQLDRARLMASFSSHRKAILVGAGAAILVTAGIVVVPKLLAPAPVVAVTVTSDVTGANVAAGGVQCTTPQCVLNLKPGSYTLTATKDGYAAISQPLVIAASDHDTKVPLAFQPLPEELQVNTNFESGKVFIDGRAAGALRDGQFSVSGVAPGKHSISVTGADASFQAEWKSAPGTVPELSPQLSAKNLQAAVVANAGHTATIACNCDASSISVDGASAGQGAGAGSVKLSNLREGQRQVSVGGRKLVVDVRPNPALNIYLALDRNVGTLIVNTGEDDVKVYLNNRVYPRQTEHGVLRIPVNVGSYSIRVEKDGFRSSGTQPAEVAKGEEKQVNFTLTSALPVLEITGAQPHARVEVDRRPVGETDANGSFRTEVSAGRHSIGLAKDGYTPIRFEEQFTPGHGPVHPTASQIAMAKLNTPPPPVVDTEPQDWARVNNSGRVGDLQDYLRNHPGGAHARDAQSQIDQLQQQAQQQAQQAETARTEQAAWDNLDKNNKGALQDFLTRHPGNPHVQDARNLLDAIQRREAADAAGAEQKKAEQERFARAAADTQAILKTISDYETAFIQKDLATMQRIYNPMPANLREQFKDAKRLRSVSFQLKPTEAPSVTGNSATVVCTRTQSITFSNGDHIAPPTERVRVTLVRMGSGWVIREISGM